MVTLEGLELNNVPIFCVDTKKQPFDRVSTTTDFVKCNEKLTIMVRMWHFLYIYLSFDVYVRRQIPGTNSKQTFTLISSHNLEIYITL